MRLALWARDAEDGGVLVAYREPQTASRVRRLVRGRLRRRQVRTLRIDPESAGSDPTMGLLPALRQNEGGVLFVTGWEEVFARPDAPELIYHLNLKRESVFAPKTAQIWWMPVEARDELRRLAPDTFSYMRLRLVAAEADEFVEIGGELGAIIARKLGLAEGSPLPASRLRRIRSLDLSFSRVIDFSPLAKINGLQTLNLTNSQIDDLKPLAVNHGLQVLSLDDTKVADLSPLAGITGLQILSLVDTMVSDLSPLAGITGLQNLNLTNSVVADLSPLAGITGLQFLSFSLTQVADLSPLAGITGLQGLSFSGTQVADLSPLAGIPNLSQVELPDGTLWTPESGPPPWA